MPRRPIRSISTPITLASVAVVLSIALIVGWILVIIQNTEFTREVVANTWLMVIGIVSLATICAVLIWFGVFLAKEIIEGRLQTTFIDSVTHELKSPLASLKLSLATLLRPNLSDEQRAQFLEMMRDDVDRLNVLIEDVLVAGRLEQAEHGHAFESVPILPVAQRCARRVCKRYHLSEEGVRLEVSEQATALTDPMAFETILNNLVDNAAKYSDPPVEIVITARDLKGDRIELSVRDNGIGMTPKQVKRVFGRFYRAPGEAVRERRGTGLGLYVVSGLARELGGRMEAASEGEGQGAVFTVTLPGVVAEPGAS